MSEPQMQFAFGPELIGDLFAGGGGASLAIEQAFGRPVNFAVNHDRIAVSMHSANHPLTRHYCEDVFEVDPREAASGRPVGFLHASPDCTHHSQARGGQPRDRKIRALSWVVVKFAGTVRPRVITLENVEQILKWSQLVAARDKATGRVVTLDMVVDAETGRKVHRVAAPGERVPVERQFLVPCPRRQGKLWERFVGILRAMGYAVQWFKLRASDYGAGTSRTRLYMVARCDGQPIVKPKPTHGKGRGLLRVRTAADYIDFSLPCPSIFTRKRPLAENTLRRIARGIKRFVLDAKEPFIVECANSSRDGIHASSKPLNTITAHPKGGAFSLAAPVLVPRYGEREGQEARVLDANAPLPTIVPTGNGASLGLVKLVAYIDQANGGPNGNKAADHDAREPLSSITTKGCQQRVVTAHLATLRGANTGAGADAPLRTVSAGGEHHAVVECTLSPEQEAGALRVAAFLTTYYGNSVDRDPREPVSTITTKDRLALVTVTLRGMPYVIVDVGLRMLTPQELFACQGFPADYIIDRGADGKRLTKTQQVRLVGNSVSPPPFRALVEANVGVLVKHERQVREACAA